MCLVLLAHRVLREYPLVLAANRDEYFARPAAPASWWIHEGVDIFGGRDLEKGGTWLGLARARGSSRGARFAVVTNVRDARSPPRAGVGSRGWLTRDALASDVLPPRLDVARFPTFNLLVGEGERVYSLRDDEEPALVAPAVHGLSNHRLDTPWPKVEKAKRALESLLVREPAALAGALFRILADDAAASDHELPSTGVPLEVERALSPAFVRLGDAYGTRCSTVIIGHARGGFDFEERTFDASGKTTGTVRERIA